MTHGTLNAKKSNAILMVTAISGSHHRLDFMIGPGRALDPTKYFIVATDAIVKGLTTSPSNSTAQPRMAFPKFTIRDMVHSQHRLMQHLGIKRVVAVIGPSMGGMQALQWGVSYPGFMDSLVALVPLAKTPAWSVAVMEASRKAGREPHQGLRRQRLDLSDVGVRSARRGHDTQDEWRLREGTALDQGEDNRVPRHEGLAQSTVTGHAAAGGLFPADVDFLNRETAAFLDLVTERGKKLE